MSHISIAIIHNGDRERLAHIRPAARVLADRVDAALFEVYEQPAVRPHSSIFLLYKRAVFWKLSRQLERYRGSERPGFIRSLLAHARLTARQSKPRFNRLSAIEAIVTFKHISAWETFVTSGADYLVVLEDDAVVLGDTAERFCALITSLSSRDTKRLLYVDLAGGFSIDELRVSALIDERRGGFIRFKRPVTNTACGYLIGRDTALKFRDLLASRPWFRHVPLDWLISALMMRAFTEGTRFDCRHADPPIFRHGSLTGQYNSSIQLKT